MKNRKPIAKSSDLVIQKTGDETLVFDLKTNKAFCLNETSANVWNLCNGKRTITQISEEMTIRMKTLVDKDLVYLALEQLHKDELLKEGFKTNEKFVWQSRREVIKRLALGSAIALPVVTGLVAPKAVSAQSLVCDNGVSCACPIGTGNGNTCGSGIPSAPGIIPCPTGCICTSEAISHPGAELGACQNV